MTMPQHSSSLHQFLKPLHIDARTCHSLAKGLCDVYIKLAKDSEEQFLPTPITDTLLRPKIDAEGRYLAIDIGGTNLRVGFIELKTIRPTFGNSTTALKESSVIRHLEKSWPIEEKLKNDQAKDLFSWIGRCIREVVTDGCSTWPGELPEEIPLGVTFSFPMVQHTLSSANTMGMGKGFALQSNRDLGTQLLEGYYSSTSTPNTLPRLKVTAIVNDAVATLVSFTYQHLHDHLRKPVTALIVGTGTNATIPLSLHKLHSSKQPLNLVSNPTKTTDQKITVNTEWSISGASPPLREHNLITSWDAQLDSESSAPGFQPFEYMTSGRYLGELGRLIIVDYFTNHLNISPSMLPPKLLVRNELRTTFLGYVKPGDAKALEEELPPPSILLGSCDENRERFIWDTEKADIVYAIAKAIQSRGSALIAAAILGLLACADELSLGSFKAEAMLSTTAVKKEVVELLVGYTGGCIDHFQDYLQECQGFLDEVLGQEGSLRAVLEACHDGGIIGAGILAGTVDGMDCD